MNAPPAIAIAGKAATFNAVLAVTQRAVFAVTFKAVLTAKLVPMDTDQTTTPVAVVTIIGPAIIDESYPMECEIFLFLN